MKNDKSCAGCLNCQQITGTGRRARVKCFLEPKECRDGRCHLYQSEVAVRRLCSRARNVAMQVLLDEIAAKRKECGVGMSKDCNRCALRTICEAFSRYCETKHRTTMLFTNRGKEAVK